MKRIEFEDKTIAEGYKFLGAITLFFASLFFFDGLINLQLIDNLIIQAVQPETLLFLIFNKVNIGLILFELTIGFMFIIIAIATIFRGLILQYRQHIKK